VLVFVFCGAPSHADTVTISYAITGGTVSAADPSVMVTGGSFSVTHPAMGTTNNHTVIAGAAVLNSFSIQFTAAYQGVGTWQSMSVLPLAGMLGVNGLGGSAFQNIAGLLLAGTHTVQCNSPAAYCIYTGYTPGVPEVLALSAQLDAAGGLAFDPMGGTVKGAFFSHTVSGGIYTGRATANFIGQEIGRVYVPEPGMEIQAMVALLSISGLLAIRRKALSRGCVVR
jgi:hypothetical protein